MKKCTKCKLSKDINEFGPTKSTKTGLMSWCRSCCREYGRNHYKQNSERLIKQTTEYNRKNKENRKKIIRKNHLIKTFGITPNDYNLILKSQNGVCLICRGLQKNTSINLAVDHCHVTGKVRGLLCDSCNNGLGRFKDNPELLIKAAEYLKRPLSKTQEPL